MEELELFSKIEAAERREYDDDHLTTDERKALVNEFLEFYKGSHLILKNFPYEKSLDAQYVWILYDF